MEAAGLTTLVPVGGGASNGGTVSWEGRVEVEGEVPPVAFYKAIGADYFAALGIELLEGRLLERADWQGGAPVALVSRTFADRFFEGDAIGRGIRWDDGAEWARVVGVVEDVREMGLQADMMPFAYLPMVVGDWGYPNMDWMHLVVRPRHGLEVPAEAVRQIVARLDPTVPLTTFRTMDDVLAREMADTSFTMVLLGIAAGIAIFLGAVGLFGVISYVVAQRTREIGVRVALGARGEDVRRMVLGQGARVVAAGTLVGLAAAAGLTRLMTSVLYGVEALDPVSFALAPLVLALVAAAATWLPARRASAVDPMVALRAE